MNENKQLLAINEKDYGITDDDAVIIAQPFAAKAQELAAMQDEIDKIMAADITRELAVDAGKLRKRIVPLRTGVAAIHKDLKASALARGRYIDSYKNSFNEISKNHEDNLREIEEHYDRLEAKRIADLQAERESLIKPLLDEFTPMPHKLGEMADDLWDNYYAGAKQAHADRIEAKAARDKILAEEARLSALRADRIAKINPFLAAPLMDDVAKLSDDEFKSMLHSAKIEYNYRISQAAIAQAEAEAKAKAEQVAHDAEAKRLADVKAAETEARIDERLTHRLSEMHKYKPITDSIISEVRMMGDDAFRVMIDSLKNIKAKAADLKYSTRLKKDDDGNISVDSIGIFKTIKPPISTKNDEKVDLTRLKSMLAHFIGSQPTLEESPAKVVRERKAMELIAELSRMINE